MSKYIAAPGSPFTDDDAAVIGPELQRIASNGGARTEEIVEAATNPSSPLHRYFEWDDQRAADKHRMWQARNLTNSILVRMRDGTGGYRHERAFFSVQIVRADDNGAVAPRPVRVYIGAQEVRDSPELVEQVMAEALGALVSWCDRYEGRRKVFAAFDKRFAAVFDVVAGLRADRKGVA